MLGLTTSVSTIVSAAMVKMSMAALKDMKRRAGRSLCRGTTIHELEHDLYCDSRLQRLSLRPVTQFADFRIWTLELR
jgi:hypothetical protein